MKSRLAMESCRAWKGRAWFWDSIHSRSDVACIYGHQEKIALGRTVLEILEDCC